MRSALFLSALLALSACGSSDDTTIEVAPEASGEVAVAPVEQETTEPDAEPDADAEPAPSPTPEPTGPNEAEVEADADRDAEAQDDEEMDEAIDFTAMPLHEALLLAGWVDKGPGPFVDMERGSSPRSGTLRFMLGTEGEPEPVEGTWSLDGDVLRITAPVIGSVDYRHVRTEERKLFFSSPTGDLVLASYAG